MADRRSCHLLSTMLILALLLCSGAASAADLQNHGPGGEYFHDPDSGLTWFDPAAFVGLTRAAAEYIDLYSPNWSWAASAQIDGLLGRTSPAGTPLIDVMGPHQVSIGGYRWVGFYAESIPDGWLVQTTNSPDFDTITDTSFQSNAASLNPGAWFVSTSDPVAAPRLEDLGDLGEYFLDHATELYWYDPEHFVGMSREEVATWLLANPQWRWATMAEVFGLLCRHTVGDVPLEEVLGARQYTAGSDQPRWLGYYAQDTAPDGLLLQCGYGPPFTIATLGSTQANAAAWNPGAWLVSELDPTPVAARTWSEVKKLFD